MDILNILVVFNCICVFVWSVGLAIATFNNDREWQILFSILIITNALMHVADSISKLKGS